MAVFVIFKRMFAESLGEERRLAVESDIPFRQFGAVAVALIQDAGHVHFAVESRFSFQIEIFFAYGVAVAVILVSDQGHSGTIARGGAVDGRVADFCPVVIVIITVCLDGECAFVASRLSVQADCGLFGHAVPVIVLEGHPVDHIIVCDVDVLEGGVLDFRESSLVVIADFVAGDRAGLHRHSRQGVVRLGGLAGQRLLGAVLVVAFEDRCTQVGIIVQHVDAGAPLVVGFHIVDLAVVGIKIFRFKKFALEFRVGLGSEVAKGVHQHHAAQFPSAVLHPVGGGAVFLVHSRDAADSPGHTPDFGIVLIVAYFRARVVPEEQSDAE